MAHLVIADPMTPSIASTASTAPFLSIDALGFHWPHAALFSGLDWHVPAGVALVHGGMASGKTTLMRLLAGVLAPTQGRILLGGAGVRTADVFWAETEATDCDPKTVREAWAGAAARFPQWDEAVLHRHTEGFELTPHLDKQFFMLSKGTRRKAWHAAALASGAPLTLIDEPFAGLDLASTRYLVSAISDAAQQPNRLVVVAHDAPLAGVRWVAELALPDVP